MNRRKCSHERLNPKEVIELLWPGVDQSHITFDPQIGQGQYFIANQASHDGTAVFSWECAAKPLARLVNRETFYLPQKPDFSRRPKLFYRVGWLWHFAVYGPVNLPIGVYPGVKERFRLRVACSVDYGDEVAADPTA